MYTSVDKAIASVIGGVLTLFFYATGIDFGLGSGVILTIGSVITSALVYFVPNKSGGKVETAEVTATQTPVA